MKIGVLVEDDTRTSAVTEVKFRTHHPFLSEVANDWPVTTCVAQGSNRMCCLLLMEIARSYHQDLGIP